MLRITRRGIKIDFDACPNDEIDAASRYCADPQFGSLQIGEDTDRSTQFGLDCADRGYIGSKARVIGVAHVDAEHIRASFEELPDCGCVPGSGTKCGDDFYVPASAHICFIKSVTSV